MTEWTEVVTGGTDEPGATASNVGARADYAAAWSRAR